MAEPHGKPGTALSTTTSPPPLGPLARPTGRREWESRARCINTLGRRTVVQRFRNRGQRHRKHAGGRRGDLLRTCAHDARPPRYDAPARRPRTQTTRRTRRTPRAPDTDRRNRRAVGRCGRRGAREKQVSPGIQRPGRSGTRIRRAGIRARLVFFDAPADAPESRPLESVTRRSTYTGGKKPRGAASRVNLTP